MIHQYQLNGYNIVLDVYSGAVHVVDDVAYDIIHICSTGQTSPEEIVRRILARYPDRPDVTREEILETLRDIETLRTQGKLFSEDTFAPNAGQLKQRHAEIKALCLHVAHTCNLTCDYCFASQGHFQGKSGLMSLDTGKRALDFLLENSGHRQNLEVDFFGGEPLMNWDVVKALVSYARQREKGTGKRFRFTLTTNGVGLNDEIIDFLNREMHNVVLSLDGRREVHDRLRRTRNGEGSYDIIVPKFQRLVAARGGKDYYIRGTFTHYNTDFLQDILHMADLGFTQLSMEPVVCGPDSPYRLTEEDLPTVLAQYEALAIEMLRRREEGRPFTFYHYMLDLRHGPCIYKRISGCGAGTEYFAVTPWGDLYPCHQFVGEETLRVGDIWHGITEPALVETFRACNVYARPECADCWARLYCSGGCAANAYHATGSITGVYEYGCQLFRKRMECAIMLQVAERMPRAEAAGQKEDPAP